MRTMNSEEYEYWCDLAGRLNNALSLGKDNAKIQLDASDIQFVLRWIDECPQVD